MKKIYFALILLVFSFSVVKAQVNLKNGLVAHYTLDGHGADSSGNGLNGTIVGSPISSVSRYGRPNTAMKFDGTNDAVMVSHDAKLNLTKDKTISLWYKIESSTGLPLYPILIYKTGINDYPTFALYFREDPAYGASRHRVCFIEGSGTTINKENYTTQNYTNYVNQWIHIVGTHNSQDGYMRIFFNGTISDSLYVGNFSSNTSTDSMAIGRGHSPYGGNNFKGFIDDIRIYDRAVTKEEIDSLYHEHLFVYNHIPKTICQGDSIFAQGMSRGTTGTYYDTINVAPMIDSVVVTQLTVNPTYLIPQTVTICSGSKILLGGKMQTTAGIYYDSLKTTLGCDSIIKTTLLVNPSYYIPQYVQLCSGQSYYAGGANQTSTGIYYDSLLTSQGCDSIIATTLVVNPVYTSTQSLEICSGDSLLLGGKYRTSGGIYYDSLSTVKGCDSVIVSVLTINPTYIFITSATICNGDSIWLGNNYQKVAGTYYDTLNTKKGCDSVKVTNLIVNPSYFTANAMTICDGDSAMIAGAYRTTAGVYQQNLNTINGCDSIVETTLTVNPTYFKADTITICLGDSAYIAGNYYYNHAVVSQNFNTAKGCDSTIQTTLLVNPTYIIPNTVNLCSGDSVLIGGTYVKTMGIYYDSLSTNTGCDSIVVTTVSVNTINTIVSQNAHVLIAQESSATYQWLDCNNANAPLSGETQQSLIATTNGSYAVAITKLGCTDTSMCYTVNTLSVDEVLGKKLSVYPNPAKDRFTVDLGENHELIKVIVTTITGKQISMYTQNNSSAIQIPADQLAAGMYMLEIDADGKKSISKIIIE